MALFKLLTGSIEKAIVICPPILLTQWAKFLGSIQGVSVQIYAGTPTARKQIELGKASFTLVGLQIFKRDYARFEDAFEGYQTITIVDVLACQATVGSQLNQMCDKPSPRIAQHW